MLFQTTSSSVPLSQTEVLIAIKPEHAAAIYSGQKRYELRKAIPKRVPRIIFLYETDGTSAVTGHVVVSRIFGGSPDAIWNSISDGGISKERFFNYFRQQKSGVAFEIENFCKYKRPLKFSEIQEIQVGFKAPQNFLYLENFPQMRSCLQRKARDEALDAASTSLTIVDISAPRRKRFVREVKQHISKSYKETGAKYAGQLLRVHDAAHDVEGILTQSKSVLEVHVKKGFAGFLVLTFKLGGSIKTGPTILFPRFRNAGLGKRLRIAVHEFASKAGYRKVYCTIPASKPEALQYLLGSGYQIEAHLKQHYHDKHDELVLGYPIAQAESRPAEFLRQIVPPLRFAVVNRMDIEAYNFLQKTFSESYLDVPQDWAQRQIEYGLRSRKGAAQGFKDRVLFAAYAAGIVAMCFCVLKRGGSAKLILLSETAHVDGMARFIDFVIGELGKEKIKKFYTHIPLTDSDVTQAFIARGFKPEGLLRMPYRQSDDLLIFGKFLK